MVSFLVRRTSFSSCAYTNKFKASFFFLFAISLCILFFCSGRVSPTSPGPEACKKKSSSRKKGMVPKLFIAYWGTRHVRPACIPDVVICCTLPVTSVVPKSQDFLSYLTKGDPRSCVRGGRVSVNAIYLRHLKQTMYCSSCPFIATLCFSLLRCQI